MIDVTLNSTNAVTKFFLGLVEFSLGIIKKSSNFCAVKIFFSEATVTSSNINEGIHFGWEKPADGKTVRHVFIFSICIFPEDFFIIIAVIIGNDFLVLLCHGNDYIMRGVALLVF